MKFLVEAPVALVPFQLEDICSALGNARAPRALTLEDVWKVLLSVRRTGNLWIRMVVPGAENARTEPLLTRLITWMRSHILSR